MTALPSYIYYIIQGKIRLSAPLSDGREFIFSDLGPGDTFDLTRLFVTRRSNLNAASVVDSDLMQIEVAFMARVFDKHPDLALKVIPYLCEATHDAQERVIHSAASALSTRLASTLLRLTERPHSMATVDRARSIHISPDRPRGNGPGFSSEGESLPERMGTAASDPIRPRLADDPQSRRVRVYCSWRDRL
ncbi:Crp/Fnr family transcriptional regulator [Mesorhizobium sp. AR10]|nr:Crp/Fnr family transcriptional regulator [Mesorhizobium sp. AR10]